MKNNRLKFKIIFKFCFVILIFAFLFLNFAHAQTVPQFLVSWQAESYAPLWYQGKIFPTRGTPVIVNFELIDGGKIADLSETKVRWYVNNQLVKNEDNGLGIKFLKFTVPDYGGGETEVRIALPDYRGPGQEAPQTLDYILHLPVNSPEVVLRNGSADRRVQAGSNSFEAIPFFFNAPSLDNIIFDWTANGQQTEGASDNPQMLNLNIDSQAPTGFQIDLRVTLRNLLSQLEIAAKNIQLQVK